ncbi:uncharacterized protein LAJ45_02043 [Morchella importuna]|uniref:uncharacterized protein n=1 Tax=Morchella importuna TaxID=1174673 RepID=UPI001E8D39AD|nr:uncharacterized protein LAJ45_02043 [Morchella importuna]KAH8154275.1 hypothetical protein LAJ45_02043 [Morchella importuna]
MPPRALPISLPEYKSLLQNLWPNVPKRLGLAVSGGVDSMALSHLTRKLLEEKQIHEVHAFIIDHGARSESAQEASSVADILKSYGFHPQVIPLTWGADNIAKVGFETRARTARFRALAKACVTSEVDKILLAHHGDDQAETVMMRLISGSRLDGLGGMRHLSRIPECWNIHNANKVIMGRPFLTVGKDRLQATCETNDVKWFEDKTNHDPTYTRRNTMRHLLTTTPSRLPRALQRESLVSLATRAEDRNRSIKEEAEDFIAKRCQIVLNERTGSLDFKLPRNREELFKDVNPAVLQRMLIIITEKATPGRRVETRHMTNAFEKVLGAENKKHIPMFTSAGLTWTYNGEQSWTLNREPLPPVKKEQEEYVLGPGMSEWMLWDGRWWMRVETPPRHRSIVRILKDSDMKALRSKAGRISPRMRARVDDALKKQLKGHLRFTIPAIFWKVDVPEDVYGEGDEVLAALPSLGLTFQNAKYEIHFKD